MASTPSVDQRWHDPADYLRAAEAIAYLAAARLAVAFLPFQTIAKWMSRPHARRSSTISPLRVAVAVERGARRVPWRAVCIHQGIACQRMLRRRGVPSEFVYGLATSDGELKAHVWVEWKCDTLIGDHAGADFASVARFPPTPGDQQGRDEPLERNGLGD